MDSIKTILAVCAVLATLVAPAAPGGARPPRQGGGARPAAAAQQPGRQTAAPRKSPAKPRRAVRTAGIEERLPPEDRRMLSAIEDADGLHELMRLYPHASRARSREVRLALVDALEEQGEQAVNLLAGLLADPDEDVAESAFTSWTSVLDDMRPRRRAAAVVSAAQAISQQSAPPHAARVE